MDIVEKMDWHPQLGAPQFGSINGGYSGGLLIHILKIFFHSVQNNVFDRGY